MAIPQMGRAGSLATSSGARSSRPPPSASRRRNHSPETGPPFERVREHFANDSGGHRVRSPPLPPPAVPMRTCRAVALAKADHPACWKRRMSASSSAIQPAIWSRENFRGSGNWAPCARIRVARKSISCCFSSGSSASAAALISSSLLTWPNYHTRRQPTTIQ